MSLNTVLRSAGLGQRNTTRTSSSSSSSSDSGRRHTPSSAQGHLLPSYSHLKQTDSSIQLQEYSRADSPNINNANGTTTTIDEIGAQDISTAGAGDFRYDPYARSQSRTDHLPLSERQREYLEDGGSDDSNGNKSPGDSPDPTMTPTKGSLLRPFLANFTIGFADGLTVPFALTAGLSWLGSSGLVIIVGAAEICAGCISMGIGGYLSAKGEKNAEAREAAKEAAEQEERRAAQNIISPQPSRSEFESDPKSEAAEATVQMSPVMSGSSVAVGYLLGGLLPLSPYFFVSEVRQGLIWSFVVCIVALFVFGSVKEFAMCVEQLPEETTDGLDEEDYSGTPMPRGSRGLMGRFSWFGDWTRRARTVPYEDIRLCLWEGVLMAGLGSVAAIAAVLCVMASQSLVKEKEGGGDKSD